MSEEPLYGLRSRVGGLGCRFEGVLFLFLIDFEQILPGPSRTCTGKPGETDFSFKPLTQRMEALLARERSPSLEAMPEPG